MWWRLFLLRVSASARLNRPWAVLAVAPGSRSPTPGAKRGGRCPPTCTSSRTAARRTARSPSRLRTAHPARRLQCSARWPLPPPTSVVAGARRTADTEIFGSSSAMSTGPLPGSQLAALFGNPVVSASLSVPPGQIGSRSASLWGSSSLCCFADMLPWRRLNTCRLAGVSTVACA